MSKISIQEAAEILGCDPKRLRDLAKVGAVPGAIRVGSRWLLNPEVIEDYHVPALPEVRHICKLYLTESEAVLLRKDGFELELPSESEARRAAKREASRAANRALRDSMTPEEWRALVKAAHPNRKSAASLLGDEDPFGSFGLEQNE